MSQFLMIVETVILLTQSERQMPLQPCIFPILVIFHLLARTHEELHLHLLELPHAENELTGDNLIAECFSGLSYTKRNLHPSALLHIEEIHENSLRRFRTKIKF